MITRSNSGQVPWDPSRELQPGPLPWGLLLARLCAHRWQEKLGVCTSLARLGDDHSIELRAGPLGSLEGTPTKSPPVGIAAAGTAGADRFADHRRIQSINGREGL
jgi:hypothetical protein